MKKLCYNLFFVFMLILAACSGNEEMNVEESSTQKSEENKEKKQEILLDLNEIGSLTKEKIHSKYGEPSTVEDTTFDSTKAPTEKYSNGLEVMYMEGIPARITYIPQEEIGINKKPKLAKMVGFDEVAPDFENDFTNRWDGIGPYHELSVFVEDGKITYFYLITDEKYK